MLRKKSLTFLLVAAVFMTAAAIIPARRALAAPAGSRYGAKYFPNTALTDQNGRVLHFYDDLIKDKIVVIDFIYTHCKDMCPLETARLAQVQKKLGDRVGKDIFFYSISIDPKADTPEVLKAYAEKFHAGPGWLFLTGKKDEIEELSKKVGLYSDPDPEVRDGHTPMLLIGDEATGEWLTNAANDNPQFVVMLIEKLGGYQNRKPQVLKNYADAPMIKLTHKGQYLFSTRCSACHTIGHGEMVGPDLLGVTSARDHDWLTHFIYKPDELLAQKDPTAMALYEKYKQIPMPNLRLGPEDVQYLISYLEEQSAAASAKTRASVSVPTEHKP